ncbi:hypothetical protein AUC70_12505 [Methyloceanibacter stevinii]|uniref:Retropepsin-like aspartic endopeptidase domain-containing protein n=1 Tax=Methyloceanibacter stevinii TaxID=1774970 RepID=A0A1E3VJH3_9HYPH|nr:RimK/LysX family protein [Methyloceanibacter stevinii]ODR93652.1 hypothetical protein AUC70_12505 [Methyloceanibacter stevinii]
MKKRVPRSKRLDGREIGWREHVALPELRIASMRAKIDTGARTSALNTDHMERFERDGQTWISFTLPAAGRRSKERYEAQLADVRAIKNTGGVAETRPIIKTTMVLGKRAWVIEISLADRENMKFDMIVGRTALRTQRLIVNPGRSYLAGDPIGPTPLESHET